MPAKLLTVQKEGPNQGKKFYNCESRTCDYFCWEDQASGIPHARSTTLPRSTPRSTPRTTQSTLPRTAPNSSFGSQNMNLETADANIVCSCGEGAKKLTVRKEGPNTGREFFKCNGGTCDFFLWADAQDSDVASGGGDWTDAKSWDSQGSNKSNSRATQEKSHQNSFPRPNSRSNAHSSEKMCECGQLAVTNTVKKDGPNKGRLFWTCSKPFGEKCNMFDWADDSTGAIPSQNSQSNNNSGDKSCECGLAAITKTVKKDGPNKGRLFWTCSKPFEDKCDMFDWADDSASSGSTQNSRKRPAPSSQATSGKQPRCCSICRLPGHRKGSCPQNNGY